MDVVPLSLVKLIVIIWIYSKYIWSLGTQPIFSDYQQSVRYYSGCLIYVSKQNKDINPYGTFILTENSILEDYTALFMKTVI